MMDATEQFVATARRLFETVPGSAAQRSANQWLIGFQGTADAWRVALDVLQRTTTHAREWPQPPTVLVVTMQLLRFKITNSWDEINDEQRHIVKQTVLAWLRDGSAASASPPAIRVACVIIANLVARMFAREWPQWHQELQQQLSNQQSHEAIVQLLEIYGAIPAQVAAGTAEPAQLANAFGGHVVEIARVAREALSIGGSVRDSALRCIEHWGIGCIASCPELGIDVALLVQSSLLPALLELSLSGEEQAATEIVADVFMSTHCDPLFISSKVIEAVVHTIGFLDSTRQTLSASSQGDEIAPRWVSISQIASSIAMHHAVAVFSPEAQRLFLTLHPPSGDAPSLPLIFLELLLACTSFPDSLVAQPTLEFWFFLLDGNLHQGVQLQLLSAAIAPDQLVGVLSRLVNALIDRCRYPQSLIDAFTLPSAVDDDSDVESITTLRKEIADTILSLFSKWPTSPTAERGVVCVKGMAALLRSSTDIATLDAVLFLLESTIELFDIDSSGSEEEEDEERSADNQTAQQSANEGAQLLQYILLDALELPNHPLLVVGVTRFYQSLSKSLVLPGYVYIRVALKLSQGLDVDVSFGTSARALLGVSKSISQYTEVQERRELLENVAAKCQRLQPSSHAAADVLEAAFRLTDGLADSDFTSFCNVVLTPLTQHLASGDAHVAGVYLLLLGRAIGGVQNGRICVTLSDQVWPLVVKAIDSHGLSSSFRECAIQFFSAAVVKNTSTPINRLQEVATFCLRWLPETAFVPTVQCVSAVVSNAATHDSSFLPIVHQILEVALTVAAQRIHFDPSRDDDTNQTQLDEAFVSDETALLAPVMTELFSLLRLILQYFATALAREAMLTTTIRLCWLLLDVDHQVQDICDSACDFLLDACSSQPLWNCSPTVSDTLVSASPHLLRAVLAFFGPKRVHYKPRNLWLFLFQLLHAPRIAAPLKAHLHSTLTTLLTREHVLSPPLSVEQSESLAHALCSTTQRHRFVTLLTQTGKQIEAMSTN